MRPLLPSDSQATINSAAYSERVHRNAYWVFPEQCTNSGDHEATCSECGLRQRIDIANFKKGKCARCDAKSRPTLTVNGVTRSVADWIKLDPNCSKLNSINTRMSQRRRGVEPFCYWSDEEILYGKKGQSVSIEQLDRHDRVAGICSALSSELTDTLRIAAEKAVNARVAAFQSDIAQLVDALSKATTQSTPRLSCADYRLKTGLTIGDHMQDPSQLEFVIQVLKRLHRYESLEEKVADLSPYIPVDVGDNCQITDLEIMALFSSISLKDLQSV